MNETQTTPHVAGAILAGGHARRMGGIAKRAIRVDGNLSCAERLVAHLACCGVGPIIMVANDGRPYAHIGCPVIPDQRRDAGPLAGIEAALAHLAGRCDAVLCLPCDVPALSSREISALLNAFTVVGGPVAFAETKGSRRHPLCAVVRADLLTEVSAALDRGALGVGALWSRLGAAPVRFDDPAAFINLNWPGDVEAWLAGRSNGRLP